MGRQRSGTGSQMKSGFGADGLIDLRLRRMPVTREMQRVGEQTMWKDLENRRLGVRSSSEMRRFGVVYLNARFSSSS